VGRSPADKPVAIHVDSAIYYTSALWHFCRTQQNNFRA